MAKSSIVPSDSYSKTIKVVSLQPVKSTTNQLLEPVFPVPLSSFKSTRMYGDDTNSKTTKLKNGVNILVTYSATDGQPISSGSGGSGNADYWITG